jgi:hypothetical protein
MIDFIPRLILLTRGWLSSHCVLTWSLPCAGRQKERASSLILSYKGPIPSEGTLWHYLIISTSQRSISRYHHVENKGSNMKIFRGHNSAYILIVQSLISLSYTYKMKNRTLFKSPCSILGKGHYHIILFSSTDHIVNIIDVKQLIPSSKTSKLCRDSNPYTIWLQWGNLSETHRAFLNSDSYYWAFEKVTKPKEGSSYLQGHMKPLESGSQCFYFIEALTVGRRACT